MFVKVCTQSVECILVYTVCILVRVSVKFVCLPTYE